MKSLPLILVMLVAATPAMAGDLKGDLLALERTAWTAWAKKDGQAFRNLVAGDASQAVAGAGVTYGRDKIMAEISAHNCETKSFEFQDARLRQLAPDVAIISYTAAQDSTCGGQKLPGRVFVTNVYVRQDGQWRSMSYQETPLD